MHSLLTSTARVIDRLNEAVGKTVRWLVVVMLFITFAVAILRYGFSLGWVWLQESYVWMHGLVFMLVSAYTFLHDGHVRIDLIYGARSDRYRAWVDLLGVLLLLYPMLLVVGWTSLPYVVLSWERLETSGSSGGLPGLFLLKTSILIFVILLALQGLSRILTSLVVLMGRGDTSGPETVDG